MSHDRHSYIPFYPSDWIAGTARMTAMQELVYFRVCCHIWDKAAPVPENELPLLLGNIENWQDTLAQLVSAGKLNSTPNGYANGRAMAVAEKARETWQAKVDAGKAGADKRWKDKRKGNETKAKQFNSTPNSKSRVLPIENQNQNQNHIRKESKDSFSKKSSNGTRLKEDFSLPDSWKDFARQEGWTDSAIDREADTFRDYWVAKSGQNATKRDWQATWRNWIRNNETRKGFTNGEAKQTPSITVEVARLSC